jgi:hypothetical protein
LIVESMDTTVVVPPPWTVGGDDVGVLELRRDRPSRATGADR